VAAARLRRNDSSGWRPRRADSEQLKRRRRLAEDDIASNTDPRLELSTSAVTAAAMRGSANDQEPAGDLEPSAEQDQQA